MRAVLLFATAVLASCSASDPCTGVVPLTFPEPINVDRMLPARVPFQDAFVGDGAGSLLFVLSDYPLSGEYVGAVYDRTGQLVSTPQGRFADSSHPRPLPQEQGFHLLEGRTIGAPKLVTYSTAGAVLGDTPVPPAKELVSSIDPSGGSLILSYEFIPGAPQALNYPWTISAQRFDAQGKPRASKRLVATDPIGQFSVGGMAGAVTTTGWTFVVWTTFQDPKSADLQGAWIAPDGAVSPPVRLGATGAGTLMDVEPLLGGGVVIAATIPPFPYLQYNWIAQLRDGATAPAPAAWLSAFPSTRLALVRGGRAHAVLAGAPYWDGAFGADRCQSTVPITLVSIDGRTCGTLSLPVPLDPTLSCISTLSSAALGREGTAVVRTFEYGTDSRGIAQHRTLARWWPQLLK